MSLAKALSIVLALAALVGCGGGREKGTLFGPVVAPAAVPRHPQVSIAVPSIADLRPEEEHKGDSVRTRLFIFFGVGVFIHREGNFITDDFTASPAAATELRQLAIQSLAASGVANKVTANGAADFQLRLSMEHLYGTHFAANKETIVVLSSKRSTDSMVDVRTHNYAGYGVVSLKAELIDMRSGTPTVVWTEHVPGYAQRPAGDNRVAEVQVAVQLAVADALSTLNQRVGAALDRLAVGPSGPPMVLASGSPMPKVFAIERLSRFRDFLERVYIETDSGRVLRHEIMPAPDRFASRPGDWLLSRVTAEGMHLAPEGYEIFARSLAKHYDLRKVDDVAHYHFFGVIGTAAPASQTIP